MLRLQAASREDARSIAMPPSHDPTEHARVAAKWSDPDAGSRRTARRFRSARRADRDSRAVARLIGRHVPEARSALDAPSGQGRLVVSMRSIGVEPILCDVSMPMLIESGTGPRVRGDALELPFKSDAVDVVVCCRLLHHFRDGRTVARALAESLRVARRAVVCSYWSSASWPGLRRRWGWSAADSGGRVERSDAEFDGLVRGLGGRVVERHRPAGRWSNQTFVVLERR
jgi:SAM-dependent methyltransferase